MPKFTAASAGNSPLSRNQKVGLLIGASALILLLVTAGLIFGVNKKAKTDASKDQLAQANKPLGTLPTSPDTIRAPDDPGQLPGPAVGPGTPAAPGPVVTPETPAAPGAPVLPGTPTYVQQPPAPPTLAPPVTPAVRVPPAVPAAPAAHTPVARHTPPAAPAIPAHLTYVIQDNDSLWSIARRAYGDGQAWTLIAQVNPGLSAGRLQTGLKINLPDPAAVHARLGTHAAPAAAAAPARTAAARLQVRSVTVHEGDTLYNIARKVYGDGEKWDVIYNANKDKLSDPDELPASVQLTIPAS
jgi:nucleoid-associated protein YgaU